MTNPYGDPQQQPVPPSAPPAGPYPGYPAGQYAPPPGYGYGVPIVGTPQTPGTVTGAAVIAYIFAGLMFLFALLCFAAGSMFTNTPFGNLGTLVAIVGLIFAGMGALYIVGAVQLQKGRNRVFLITVASIVGGLGLLSFLTSLGEISDASGVIIPLISIGAQGVIVALCLQPATVNYIAARRAMGR